MRSFRGRPTTPLRASLAAVACTVLLGALTACGVEDGKASPAEKTERAAGTSSDCDATELRVTETASGAETLLDHAAVISIQDGAALTLYAADFDLSVDSLSAVAVPTVPAGSSLTTIALTVFNATETPEPFAAGDTVPYSDEFGVPTFRVIHTGGAGQLASNTGAAGSVEVLETGKDVCIEIDYQDEEKVLTGTVVGPVKALA